MRRTYSLLRVALALMADPLGQHWGYDLMKRSGVRSGVLYPILQRMLDDGWVADGWEELTDEPRKRPARRYYQLTDRGRKELGAVVSDARLDVRFVPPATVPGVVF